MDIYCDVLIITKNRMTNIECMDWVPFPSSSYKAKKKDDPKTIQEILDYFNRIRIKHPKVKSQKRKLGIKVKEVPLTRIFRYTMYDFNAFGLEEIEEYYPNCEIILIDTFLVDECDDEIKYVSINPLCKDENFFLDCIQVHAHRLGFQEGFLCSEDIELNEKVKSEKKLLCHFLTIENSIGSKEQLYDQLAESVTNSIVKKGSKKRLDMESFKTLEYSSH